jgi:hypothetical protein
LGAGVSSCLTDRLKGRQTLFSVEPRHCKAGKQPIRIAPSDRGHEGIDVSRGFRPPPPGFLINGPKREQLIATNSMILHGLFFDGLGDESEPGRDLRAAIERDFGSYARWRAEFIAMAKVLRWRGPRLRHGISARGDL